MTEILGKGAFSNVIKGEYNGIPCAIKNIDKKANRKKYLIQEINILKRLQNCKYIVKMLDYNISDTDGFIKYELLDKSLDEKIDDMTQDEKESVIYQIRKGIDEIHACGVIHTDIKPDNIMLDFNGNVKIIDFGNAVLAEEINELNIAIGVTQYHPPEYIIDATLDHRVDLWEFGCMVYEILTGDVLFHSYHECNVSKKAALLGQMMLILGKFKPSFLKSGKKTSKYFDVNNEYKYLYSYLLEEKTTILKLLKYNKVHKPEYWSCYITVLFTRE